MNVGNFIYADTYVAFPEYKFPSFLTQIEFSTAITNALSVQEMYPLETEWTKNAVANNKNIFVFQDVMNILLLIAF